MDWLEFSVEMTKALAWPLAAVLGALFLRPNLKRWFIDRPSKMKLGPAEFEWDATIADVRSDLELTGSDSKGAAQPDHSRSNLVPQLSSDPFAEALATYSKIEATLRARLQYIGYKPARPIGIKALVQESLAHDIIWEPLAQSILKLANLRRMAVHGFDAITEGQSYEFALTAAQVYGRLASLEVPGLDTADSATIYCGANALILDNEGKILILKVNWEDHWVLPGGNIGWGEIPSDSCIRSVAEQLEIVVAVSRPTAICWFQESLTKSTIQFLFHVGQLASVQEASMAPRGDEITEMKYVSLEEIGEYLDSEMSSLITPEILASSGSYLEVADPSIKPIRTGS